MDLKLSEALICTQREVNRKRGTVIATIEKVRGKDDLDRAQCQASLSATPDSDTVNLEIFVKLNFRSKKFRVEKFS